MAKESDNDVGTIFVTTSKGCREFGPGTRGRVKELNSNVALGGDDAAHFTFREHLIVPAGLWATIQGVGV